MNTTPPVEPEIPILPPATRLITLDNGLTLIVREDHSAPVVSAQAWCKAGSIDEGRWLGAGLSHTLEHMLFKGTATRGAGRIDQEVQEAGGSMNAYTSFDRTVYYINVPNTGASVALDILCDIMCHASLPEDELEKEKQVILREMDMCHDDPGRRSGRRLFETAYTRSPYRYTIIGYPDIFKEFQRADLMDFYREKYAPNNLFFVVVGDIEADAVERQIRAAFAGVKARPLPPVVLPPEPRQAGPREIVEEAPVELGHFHVAWHIPDVRHPDLPALDVLATLLGTGHSSRLFQAVRERLGLAHSTEAWTYNPGNPGLFGLSGVVDADKFAAARDAMLAEVEQLRRQTISSAELAKAVKQITASTLATRKTMQGQAQDLGGNWMAAGDLSFSERYLARVRRLTPGDLQRVACDYLTTENRSLYGLMPEGSTRSAAASKPVRVDSPVRKIELANGLRLLVKEDHRLPFVEIRAVFNGGVLAETAANNGLTVLLAKMLLKGTSTRSAEQIATEIESLGGSIDSYGGNNSFGISLEVLRDDLPKGLDLLRDLLLDPVFPSEALERERQVQLAGIRAQRDHLLQSAGLLMRRTLFGDQSYGLDAQGREESVARLQDADLRAFHRNLVTPNNAVLAVYGDARGDEVQSLVESHLGAWLGGTARRPEAGRAPMLREVRRVTGSRDKKQAVLVVGFPGVSLFEDDRYALELLQEALSDLGSRLFLRIREQLGLAYYVGAQNFLGLQPGYFSFYAGTAPEKAEQVEKELLLEAAALQRDGLTPEELTRARAKVIGQKKIARQDLGDLALTHALDELYGLGYAHSENDDARYEAVTTGQIQTVARRHLNPGACVVAVLQPEPAATG